MPTLFDLIDNEQRARRNLAITNESEAMPGTELLREAEQELIQTSRLRREKVDRLFFVREKFNNGIKLLEEEKERLLDAIQKSKNELQSIDNILYLGRNRIRNTILEGINYGFQFRKKPKVNIYIEKDAWDSWSENERNQFLIQEEVTILQRKVLRSISGEIIDRTVTKKNKTQIYPDLDAIRNANQKGNSIPNGVKVVQEYSIKSIRTTPTRSLESCVE